MSVQQDRGAWLVRWRDGSGRQRGKRFASEDAACEFDHALGEIAPAERRADGAKEAGGVYSYPTKAGMRWYFKFRGSEGAQTTKRGFTSARAARDARRRLTEKIERGEVRHTRESFGEHWQRWLARRKPYLEPGTWTGYEIDGRKRLLPAFKSIPLGRLGVEHVRIWMEEQAEAVDTGEIAPKTVNNALGTFVVCLNSALEDGLIATNPALRVPRLPAAHIEREYLRLHEIPVYLDSCSDVYRPVAELLIGSGLRISEALALRVSDLELKDTGAARPDPRAAPRAARGNRLRALDRSDPDRPDSRRRALQERRPLRKTRRRRTDPRLLRSTGPPSLGPRWQPPDQSRASRYRDHPWTLGPGDTRLPTAQGSRGQDPHGGNALPQAPPRAALLPATAPLTSATRRAASGPATRAREYHAPQRRASRRPLSVSGGV
jgi:integrase